MASTEIDRSSRGSKAAAVANMVVHTMSEYTGRGPTKARAHFSGDVVTVVLHETLTNGERSLVADGRSDVVLGMRKAFQDTMRHALVGGAEEILGRNVVALMNDNHIDPDLAIEVFILAPNGARPWSDDASDAAWHA